MADIKIKITASTNSAASKPESFARTALGSVAFRGARHNGGKVVIVEVPETQLAAAEAALDASHSVTAYEVL